VEEPFTYRPLDTWEFGPINRHRAPFSAGYGKTIILLDRELRLLDARNVVIQVALVERDIRIDGRPKARAVASHPGVVLSFDSKHGPLRYGTGEYATWQDNIRAIALSLEALRAVDRYGVSRRGEQYRGWKALPQTTGGFTSADQAAAWLADTATEHGYPCSARDLQNGHLEEAYRAAARALHPDAPGGSHEEFVKLQTARQLIAPT
jgi:hypothetical protein